MSNDLGKASINLKMSDGLKEKIKTRADIRKQTVSKYIRELLSNYFDGSLCKAELDRNEKREYINSTEFLKLIVWIYSKKRSKEFKETTDDLDKFIGTLKKAELHLPKNLASELDKVLFDLIRVKNEASNYSKDYKFADGYSSSPEFNFEILEKYIRDYERPITVPPSLTKNNSLTR